LKYTRELAEDSGTDRCAFAELDQCQKVARVLQQELQFLFEISRAAGQTQVKVRGLLRSNPVDAENRLTQPAARRRCSPAEVNDAHAWANQVSAEGQEALAEMPAGLGSRQEVPISRRNSNLMKVNCHDAPNIAALFTACK